MDEAERLRADRAWFRFHCASFLLGLAGWLVMLALHALVEPWFGHLVLIASSLALTASGVAAIAIKRTMFSNRPQDDLSAVDPYDPSADAPGRFGLRSLHPWSAIEDAQAPWAFLLVGLVFLGLSLWWVLG